MYQDGEVFPSEVVGRKDGTGKVENTDGMCSQVFWSLLGKDCGKGLGWPQPAQPACTPETRLWEMCCGILVGLACGRSDARFPLWWEGSVSVGVPTIDYFGVGFEDLGGRSVLGEGRLPGSQAEKQSSNRF